MLVLEGIDYVYEGLSIIIFPLYFIPTYYLPIIIFFCLMDGIFFSSILLFKWFFFSHFLPVFLVLRSIMTIHIFCFLSVLEVLS